MNNLVQGIKDFFEQHAFGVCSWWGEKLGIKTAHIRLFFVYASFLTVGSPLIVYMIMAFILNIRNSTRSKKSSVWDL